MTEFLISFCLVVGALITLIGAIGMARLPDFFTRLHAASKASTLGVGAILLAALIHSYVIGAFSPKLLLIALFIFLTTPVSGHLLSRAALLLKQRSMAPPPCDAP